ncbi:MAG: ATP-binding cassette domain-containing protein [Anaerolineales bacterium]|nr:ATP-binding cassette domain-containing protein [Anaerolineales bacterium]
MTLLEVRGLSKAFAIRAGGFTRHWARVVDDVSFSLNAGETLGLVGESGCGKTTLARCILRIAEPTAGEIVFDGTDLVKLSRGALRARRSELAIVYQNPYLSLSPRLSVHDLVAEPLVTHTPLRGAALTARVIELLQAVGLSADDLRKRARQLSGGQAQRVAIARALALRPKLIVLDEPTSALDVSVQAQVLNLLVKLQRDYGLTYLFISHNLDVVQHMADRILVMYLGRVAESGPSAAVFSMPRHPYTLALLAATPEPDPTRPAPDIALEGNVPSPLGPPTGCRFHPRCSWAQDRCKAETPALRSMRAGHLSACHFAEALPGG